MFIRRFRLTVLVVVGGLTLVSNLHPVAHAAPGPGSVFGGRSPAVPESGALFGALVAVNKDHTGGPTNEDAQLGFEEQVGRKLAIDKNGYAWDEEWPGDYDYWSRDQGRSIVFSWHTTKMGGGQTIPWAAIAAGRHDAEVDAKAEAIKAFGAPVTFVFNHEPERDVGVGGTAEDFVRAYRHVHDRFEALGVTNVSHALVLMAFTYRQGDPDQYYPGDDYVDLVGANGYNWFTCDDRDEPWESFQVVFEATRDYAVDRGKPVYVAEWGSVEDPAVPGRKARWIADAAATMKTWPEVKLVTYYNNGTPAARCDWWIDSSQSSIDAFTDMGADPYFNPPPPLITITSGPADPHPSLSASFEFESNVPGSTFTCSVDGGVTLGCSSGHTVNVLTQGSHTMRINATDPITGLRGTILQTWSVDSVPPVVTVEFGPQGYTKDTDASFHLVSNEPTPPGTFTCQLDSGPAEPCSQWSADYFDLSDGPHTFTATAYDEAGNPSIPVIRSWTVDTVAPTATISSGPASPTNSKSATFTFTSNEPGATFKCSKDGGAFLNCSSPKTYNWLATGAHTVSVRAVDLAGNQSASASWTWTIDATKPITTITSGPSNPTNSKTATFNFTANEGGVTFTCQLDGGVPGTCSSGIRYEGLSVGNHTFHVYATDAVGNVGKRATWKWQVTA